jgi:molybdopterin synthase catalytic subunit
MFAVMLSDAPLITPAQWFAGAVVTFEGRVRDEQGRVTGLHIEHYPGMTEREIGRIVDQAAARWPLSMALVTHRVGLVPVNELIVRVQVASEHRREAFEACAFIMDYLKTRAPFWKKEISHDGEGRWVEMQQRDRDAAARWQQANEQ